jgi:hypothetical protein
MVELSFWVDSVHAWIVNYPGKMLRFLYFSFFLARVTGTHDFFWREVREIVENYVAGKATPTAWLFLL